MTGFWMVKAKLIKSSDSGVLSSICLYLVTPLTIMNSFLLERTRETTIALILTFIAAVGAETLFIICGTIFSKPFKQTPVESCSAIYANAGNLMIPIVGSMLGPEWIVFTLSYMVSQNFLFWTHLRVSLTGEKKIDWKALFINPNMAATVAGLLIYVLGIRLSGVIPEFTASVAATIGPLSMWVTGMLFAAVDFKKVFSSWRMYQVLFLRLILFPALALPFFVLFVKVLPIANAAKYLFVVFLGSAGPTASTVPQMARLCNSEPEYAGAINVATTLLCILTMPVMAMLYTHFLPF